MPKVSIIVPVYNVEKYIEKCIMSVLNQTFTDFELILVNDGSKDSSGSICDKYAQIDERIRVIHKPNGGVSSARNEGIRNSKGKFIGFIDGDDYIEPEMYQVLVNNIENNDADISICGFKVYDEDLDKVERIQDSGKLEVLNQKQLVEKETDMPWSIRLDTINKLFRKSSLDGLLFNEELKCAEDTLFLHQAIRKMNKGVFVELPLYVNVKHSGSAMRGSLSPNSYYISYNVDKQIHDDIKDTYPDLYSLSYLVLLNNCIWKLEDVCENKRGNATKEDKVIIKKMRRFTRKLSFNIFGCSNVTIKQKIALFLIATGIRNYKKHKV